MKISLILFLGLLSLSVYSEELPFVSYPFHPARGIVCDQGTESPAGNSHTYNNTLYALDLATPKSADPAGLYASIDGKVVSYNNCSEHNTNCGSGFGNYVQIFGSNGTLVMYAHLEKVIVKTGDNVQSGQFIGVEGNTGLTGSNNRHLHFSVHQDWRDNGFDYYSQNLGHLPPSIPFSMNICQPKYGTCNNSPVDVRKIKCKRITNEIEWITNFKI